MQKPHSQDWLCHSKPEIESPLRMTEAGFLLLVTR
jgi:hypothetical protein